MHKSNLYPDNVFQNKKVTKLGISQSDLGGYNACTTISVYFCLFCCYRANAKSLNLENMIIILEKSTNIWKKESHKKLEYATEVLNRSQELQTSLKVIKEIFGLMTNNNSVVAPYKESKFHTLSDAIDLFYECGFGNFDSDDDDEDIDGDIIEPNSETPYCTGVFTKGAYSIGIALDIKKGCALLLDSHNRNDDGFISKYGKNKEDSAVIVYLKDQKELELHLYQLFGSYNSKSNILNGQFNITVFSKV